MSGLSDGLLVEPPFLNVFEPEFRFAGEAVAFARATNWYASTPAGMLVLRYADVKALYRDRRLVSDGAALLTAQGITAGALYDWFTPMILFCNGQEHQRLRRLISQAFVPRVIAQLRQFVISAAAQLADRLPDGRPVDFMKQFANPLAFQVMARLLGIPPADYDVFRSWSNDLGLVWSPDLSQRRERVEQSVLALDGYVRTLITARRASSGDDLVSTLVEAADADGGLTDDELSHLLSGLIFAGHETTALQLGYAMAVFAEHPDQWYLLGRHPELAAQAVEETLRWAPNMPVIYRFAAEPVQYREARLPAGTRLALCVASAHRDPQAFVNADRFDIAVTRESTPMAFGGGGPHYCVGASVARMELAEALLALARRFGSLSIAGTVAWRPPIGIFGPTALPLSFAG